MIDIENMNLREAEQAAKAASAEVQKKLAAAWDDGFSFASD